VQLFAAQTLCHFVLCGGIGRRDALRKPFHFPVLGNLNAAGFMPLFAVALLPVGEKRRDMTFGISNIPLRYVLLFLLFIDPR
jgi:hypothetical protein